MYGLVVRFELRQGHEEGFDRLVAETVKRIETEEPGTLCYVSHQVDDLPQTRVFYELYRDEAAFKDHEGKAHVRRFLVERDEHLVGPPEVTLLTSGPGVLRSGVSLREP